MQTVSLPIQIVFIDFWIQGDFIDIFSGTTTCVYFYWKMNVSMNSVSQGEQKVTNRHDIYFERL